MIKTLNSYGLIGFPLSHSFSKKYFTQKFENENIINCEYNLFPMEDIKHLTNLIIDTPSLRGLNVTIPYKEKVIPFLDELDETAKAVNAVNCIKILPIKNTRDFNPLLISKIGKEIISKKLIGYNTDIYGFRQAIKPFLEIQHQRALILGTGGASKAVGYVLKEIGIDCFFVSRSKNEMPAGKQFLYEEINEYIISSFKLIINTSPLGMYPFINEAPALPYQYLQASHLLVDLIYNPAETEFIKRGKLMGASTLNGLSMLHQQAEEAWRIWNQ